MLTADGAVGRRRHTRADLATWLQPELLDAASEPIIAVDLARVIVSWNRAAEEMFGWSSAEAIGRRSPELISRVETTEQALAIRTALVRGESWSGDYEIRRRDGSTLSVGVTNRPVLDGDGKLVAVIAVCVDATHRTAERRALEASERRLAEAQRVAHVGSFELDVTSGRLSWSAELYRILGLDPDLPPSDPLFLSAVHPDDVTAVGRTWLAGLHEGTPLDFEFRIVRFDGEERFVRARAVPEQAEDGSVVTVFGTLMDDTERVEADRVRWMAESRFETGFEQSGVGAVIVDLEGIPVRVNAAVCALLGRPEEELVGRRWTAYTHADEVPLGHMVLSRMAEGHDTYHDERRYVRPDGTVVWASTHATVVRGPSGEPEYLFGQFEDITARKELEQELTHQTLHDSLTGLPNRALLLDRLAHSLTGTSRPGHNVTVISIDVDGFRMINETYGAPLGDALLQQIAPRIVEASRPGDTVARSLGDEFVVICEDVTAVEAEGIAEGILHAIGQPFVCEAQHLQVTASLGIAVASERATPESLLRDAGVAVHRAKERGRGRAELFDGILRGQAERRTATMAALRQALERDEFVVHYQPVVDLETGRMVSAEALVRWERPGHGLVPPDDFIPLAEESGLITPIGAWVLEEACRQLAGWQRIDPLMSVAVNLSVRQITAPDVVDLVDGILERTGVHPEGLCLELTESVLMDDVDYFGTILARLKALGVRLSIDDFGTGYSSLSYLKTFPVDAVKVDRAFVAGLGTSPHDSALVAAIIAMAAALDLEVTAEGVETHDQLVRLKDLRSQRAQGYYLARPMSDAALHGLIVASHRWPVGPVPAS